MNHLNSLIIEGVVIGEPHYLKEKGVLNFSIETTRYIHNKEGDLVPETSQFEVVSFGKMETLSLEEGKGVRLVGRLKENKWTDGDGVSHSKVQIVAEHIEKHKD